MKRIDKDYWLFNTVIAHRGLYDNENGIPENTKPAYEAAIEKGYIIEMDVQMTLDGKLFCFHDDNANRICGVDKDVRDMIFNEVKLLKPFGYEGGVMTFEEFLTFIDGRVPLLIEIKNQKSRGIVPKVIKALENYKGKFVVQSFNPMIMREFQKLKPEFIRGMLVQKDYGNSTSKQVAFMLKHFLFKLFVTSDFYNIKIEDLKKCRIHTKGKPVLCWTLRSEDQLPMCEKYADNVIFEISCKNLGRFN